MFFVLIVPRRHARSQLEAHENKQATNGPVIRVMAIHIMIVYQYEPETFMFRISL
jgi:hypothetical protein